MIDAAAEALARRILVVFPASTARTRADVKRIQVPVGRLLGAVLDRQADRFAALPDTAWLDRSQRGLPAAAAAWREALRASAQFPPEAWEEHLSQAARLALSHLVRPAETAAADAFADGEARLPVPAALARVRVFGAYGYLPEIAARYAERKGIAELDRAGLERLLRRIDRRMVEDFGPDEWVALAAPLYDLMGPVSDTPGAVGTGLLRALFEAKGRDDLARTLVADDYTRDTLRARLADVILTPPAAPTSAAISDPPTAAAAPEPATPTMPDAQATATMPVATPPPAPSAPEPVGLMGDDLRGVTGAAPTHIGDVATGEVETGGVGMPAAATLLDAFEPELPHAPELEDLPTTPPNAPDRPEPSAEATDDAVAAATDAVDWGDPVPTASPREVAPPSDSESGAAEPDTTEFEDAEPVSSRPTEAGAPAEPEPMPEPPAPDEDEPLWKRMLRPAESAMPVAPGAPAQDVLPAAGTSPSPTPDAPPSTPMPAPSADEPLWRRFAVPEAAPPAEDDEDGWAVEPTLAAVPAAPLPSSPLPPALPPSAPLPPAAPRTLADTFAAPMPAPLAETAAPAPPEAASRDAVAERHAPGDASGPLASASDPVSLDALEQAVLGTGEPERREWFVNALFDGSAADYRATLEQLAAAPSWTAATEIIASEIFRKHRVNIYSDASLAFTDAVEARMDARG